MNNVTFEMAVMLKDAGFPQPASFETVGYFSPTALDILKAFGADAQFVMFWYDISVDAFRCDIAIGTWSTVAPPNKNGADAADEIWLAWRKWKENKIEENEQF